MKRFFIFLFAFVCCALFVNCSKDDFNDNGDEYYVRYYCSKYSTLSYTEADGKTTSWTNNNKALNVTIGPVKKGFQASLSGYCSMNPALHPAAGIQVSKNGGPMVDKCLVNINTYYSGNVSLSYKIDF